MYNLGNVGVRYPIPEDYNNPNEGGGPIRRTPLVAAAANAGNVVYRSPNAIVPDMQPGGAFEPKLWGEKFLPDGRIVPDNAMVNEPWPRPSGQFAGQFGAFAFDRTLFDWHGLPMLLTFSTLLGTIVGTAVSRGSRWQGAGLGLVSGALGGLMINAAVERHAQRSATRVGEVAAAARVLQESATV